MNIAGFILLSIFAACSFGLAYIMGKEDKKNYEGKHSATATVSHTEVHRHSDGDAGGYRYIVTFTDHDGREAVGESEIFHKKRVLEKKQLAEVYYWQEEETETSRKMGQFLDGAMNTVTKAMFNKEYEPDTRPKYKIHFCEERIYKAEKVSDKRGAIIAGIFGCAMLVMGVVILLTV